MLIIAFSSIMAWFTVPDIYGVTIIFTASIQSLLPLLFTFSIYFSVTLIPCMVHSINYNWNISNLSCELPCVVHPTSHIIQWINNMQCESSMTLIWYFNWQLFAATSCQVSINLFCCVLCVVCVYVCICVYTCVYVCDCLSICVCLYVRSNSIIT